MKLKILKDTMVDGKPVKAGIEIEVNGVEGKLLIDESKAVDALAPVEEIEIAFEVESVEKPPEKKKSTPRASSKASAKRGG